MLSDSALLGLPAPAKLNLFLHVVGRRPDGKHLLESVFTLIDLHDTIDLFRLEEPVVERTGDVIGNVEKDLCVRPACSWRPSTSGAACASMLKNAFPRERAWEAAAPTPRPSSSASTGSSDSAFRAAP